MQYTITLLATVKMRGLENGQSFGGRIISRDMSYPILYVDKKSIHDWPCQTSTHVFNRVETFDGKSPNKNRREHE